MVAGKPMSVVYSVGAGSVKPRIRAGNYVYSVGAPPHLNALRETLPLPPQLSLGLGRRGYWPSPQLALGLLIDA